MSVKCPKCSFEQPEDVFCAQCGVNMEKYTAKLPLTVRLAKNSHLYMFLILAVMIGSFIYLKNNWFEKTFQFQFVPNEMSDESGLSSYDDEGDASDEEETRQPASTPTVNATSTFAAAANASNTGSQQPKDFYFTFAEVHLGSLRNIVEIPNFSLKVVSASTKCDLSKLDALSKDTSVFRSLHQEHLVLNGTQEGITYEQLVTDHNLNDQVGFRMSFTIEGSKDKTLSANLFLRSNFSKVSPPNQPDTEETRVRLTYNESGCQVFTGLLPHRPAQTYEAEIFQNTLLATMLTPEFQADESDFVLIVEYK